MAGQKVATPSALKTIQSLDKSMKTEKRPSRRLTIAQRIHDLGIAHRANSPERRAAANALFKALARETDEQAIRKLGIMIKSLRFRVEMVVRRDESVPVDGKPHMIVSYQMTGPFPKRRGKAVPRRQKKRKERAEEEKPEKPKWTISPEGEKPLPERPLWDDLRRYGMWVPGAPLHPGVITPLSEEEKKWEEVKKSRTIAPTGKEGRARKLVANLPGTTTQYGASATSLIGIDALLKDARKRMEAKLPKKGSKSIPRHQALANVAPGLPLWPPDLIEQFRKWFETAGRPEVRPPFTVKIPKAKPPSLSSIKKKYDVGPIDKYMLIATLDKPTGREKRKFAAALIAEFKVAEAMPLLLAILRHPEDMNAEKELVGLVAFAIYRIGGEGLNELRRYPDLYEAAQRFNLRYQ